MAAQNFHTCLVNPEQISNVIYCLFGNCHLLIFSKLLLSLLFKKKFFLSKLHAQREARTYDSEIKTCCMLCPLSQSGAPVLFLFIYHQWLRPSIWWDPTKMVAMTRIREDRNRNRSSSHCRDMLQNLHCLVLTVFALDTPKETLKNCTAFWKLNFKCYFCKNVMWALWSCNSAFSPFPQGWPVPFVSAVCFSVNCTLHTILWLLSASQGSGK